MRAFACPVCSGLAFFENSQCLSCSTPLGYEPASRELVALGGQSPWWRCGNADLAACNWVVPAYGPQTLCPCCLLTRTRPDDDDTQALVAFAEAEAAKRRLLFQLLDLGLPVVSRRQNPDRGLAFDLLSSRHVTVTTGHDRGLIQIDLAETDDTHREQVRQALGEAYRTMLGHLRHEVGHYYWMVLVEQAGRLLKFRELFGYEGADYSAAVGHRYYGVPGAGNTDWQSTHISAYAAMHPWEDWAETFAHYLHIRDTLQTAAAYGLAVAGPDQVASDLTSEPEMAEHAHTFKSILSQWLPLTYALNAVNRSMGREDLYPFTISPPVVAKLTWVHERVIAARQH